MENNYIISLLCQLINGFNICYQTSESLQHSKVLLKCLEYEPDNYRLINFISNYISTKYRYEFVYTICQTYTDNVDILKIIIREIKMNKCICNEIFLDTIIDGLKYLNDDIDDGIECIMELIDRMKKSSNVIWENILRLKHKYVFKLIKKEFFRTKTRILVSKLIVQ